jgi:hypothetical protein
MFRHVSRQVAGLLVVMGVATHVASAQSDGGTVKPSVGTVDGLVTDTVLAPIVGATVSLLGSDLHVVTGENGRFRIVGLASGDHVLLVRRLGFEGIWAPVHVEAGETSRLTIALDPVAAHLDAVEVRAHGATTMKMAEFNERRTFGQGIFLTHDEIERQNKPRAFDLLQGIPSIKVFRNSMGDGVVLSTRASCALQILVDGFPVGAGNIPSPRELAGIEVYSGPATVPMRYQNTRGARCGVVLMWTGDGR